MFRKLAIAAALSLLTAPAALAADAKYLEAFPAHHVIANIYYVGTLGQANFLITQEDLYAHDKINHPYYRLNNTVWRRKEQDAPIWRFS